LDARLILRLSHPLIKVNAHRPPDDPNEAMTWRLSPATIHLPIVQNKKDRKKRKKTAPNASSHRKTHGTANCNL